MTQFVTHREVEAMTAKVIGGCLRIGLGVLGIIAVINFVLLQVYYSEKAHGEMKQNERDTMQEELIRQQTREGIRTSQSIQELTKIMSLQTQYSNDYFKRIEARHKEAVQELRQDLKELEKR